MRFDDFSWLFIILLFISMFFLHGCGWSEGCGVPRFHKRPTHDSKEYKLKKEEILRR